MCQWLRLCQGFKLIQNKASLPEGRITLLGMSSWSGLHVWTPKDLILPLACQILHHIPLSYTIINRSEEWQVGRHLHFLKGYSLDLHDGPTPLVWCGVACIDVRQAAAARGPYMPCELTFLLLVWTLIHLAHDSLQNLLHFMTFCKINGRCQPGALLCIGCNFCRQIGQRSSLWYLTRQMQIWFKLETSGNKVKSNSGPPVCCAERDSGWFRHVVYTATARRWLKGS